MQGFRGVRSTLRLSVKSHPYLYPILKRLKGHDLSYYLCTRNSHLCVEGYPCCANSFMYVLLKRLNPTINIAHHTHSTANVHRALMFSVPAVVLIRHPKDAISSRLARFGGEMNEAVAEYLDFYSEIRAIRDRVVLIDFADVVNDGKAVVRLIRTSSGVPIDIHGQFEDIVQEIQAQMQVWSDKYGNPETISLPTRDREQMKREFAEELDSLRHLGQAEALYHDLSTGVRMNNLQCSL